MTITERSPSRATTAHALPTREGAPRGDDARCAQCGERLAEGPGAPATARAEPRARLCVDCAFADVPFTD